MTVARGLAFYRTLTRSHCQDLRLDRSGRGHPRANNYERSENKKILGKTPYQRFLKLSRHEAKNVLETAIEESPDVEGTPRGLEDFPSCKKGNRRKKEMPASWNRPMWQSAVPIVAATAINSSLEA